MLIPHRANLPQSAGEVSQTMFVFLTCDLGLFILSGLLSAYKCFLFAFSSTQIVHTVFTPLTPELSLQSLSSIHDVILYPCFDFKHIGDLIPCLQFEPSNSCYCHGRPCLPSGVFDLGVGCPYPQVCRLHTFLYVKAPDNGSLKPHYTFINLNEGTLVK